MLNLRAGRILVKPERWRSTPTGQSWSRILRSLGSFDLGMKTLSVKLTVIFYFPVLDSFFLLLSFRFLFPGLGDRSSFLSFHHSFDPPKLVGGGLGKTEMEQRLQPSGDAIQDHLVLTSILGQLQVRPLSLWVIFYQQL